MTAGEAAKSNLRGMIGAALLALDFVTEPETWPVFAAWVAKTKDPPGLVLDDTYRTAMIASMALLECAFQNTRPPGGG